MSSDSSTLVGCRFETTQWSVIFTVTISPEHRGAALERLCRTYWPPVYAYIRRRGYDRPAAQDLTQSFFAALLERNALEDLHPEHGRFRAFLIASINNFLANNYDHTHAAKRGGGKILVSIDDLAAEEAVVASESDEDAVKSLDRRWALTVMQVSLERLKAEMTNAGRLAVFDRLKRFLQENPQSNGYVALGAELKMNPRTVAVAVHRLRQRYRDLVRREVIQTVADPRDVEDELHHLREVVSKSELV